MIDTEKIVPDAEPRMTRKEHWEAINKERAGKKAAKEAALKNQYSRPQPIFSGEKTGAFGKSLLK